MYSIKITNNFDCWRKEARQLLNAGVTPDKIVWQEASQNAKLFDEEYSGDELKENTNSSIRVPFEYLELAEQVSCHRSPDKWDLLYRLLYRVTRENRHLLQIESDIDVRNAVLRAKAVHRDYHKMKAFVRFRRVEFGGMETFVAWHRPSHFVVQRTAPFFVDRFGSMRFSILTPDCCAHWDLENLTFTDGVDRSFAPQSDELEDFWRTYYAATFNPARLRVRAMKTQMPVKFWQTLPEADLIPNLINKAKEKQNRVSSNLKNRKGK